MLWAIAVILFLLWLFGFLTAHVFGGFLHLLLILAIIIIIVRLLR